MDISEFIFPEIKIILRMRLKRSSDPYIHFPQHKTDLTIYAYIFKNYSLDIYIYIAIYVKGYNKNKMHMRIP